MPVETLDTTSSGSTVTRNGLGARGIDRIERVNSSGTTVGYPLFDSHGNMVATLGKSGYSYTLGDQRAYDAWGVIRQGATSGDPKGRYCANLGHVDDDESGLTYMRARYYEAASGRFVSEDPARQGSNWVGYCGNDPVNKVDTSGQAPSWLGAYLLLDVISVIGSYLCAKGAIGYIAAYGAWTVESILCAGGYLVCVGLGIYAGLSTGASLMQAVVVGSLDASINGHASEILGISEKLKQFSAMAPLGHMLEVCGWLGVAISGDE